MRTVLYHVTFAYNDQKRFLHLHPCEHVIASVHAIEDSQTFEAYHLDDGKHLVPDYGAIRAAIPHYHRKAYDRARAWGFPKELHSPLSGLMDYRNACSKSLYSAKGKLLGTLYATPYLFAR